MTATAVPPWEWRESNTLCVTDTIRGTRFRLNKPRLLFSYALFLGRSRVKTLQIA